MPTNGLIESILDSIKIQRGIDLDNDSFNSQLIIYINTYLADLNQLGVGVEGFQITSRDETWESFLGADWKFNAVQTYVGLQCQLVFDPPASSAAVDSINRQLSRLEFRIFVRGGDGP